LACFYAAQNQLNGVKKRKGEGSISSQKVLVVKRNL
jgi:hypothetical protein